jgi:diamine N-acetyltransferase
MDITEKSVVTLREITKATVWKILKLKPSDDQRQFVASNAESIAEAYFQQDYAWFRAIYADECPVGFIMTGMDPKDEFCFLWRFMIDEKHQKKGFGKRALELVFEYLKTQTKFLTIITSYHEASGDPSGFYKKNGFAEAGAMVKQSELGKRIMKAGEISLQLSLS